MNEEAASSAPDSQRFTDTIPKGGFVRRLRAVAAIDVVGYSKLMSMDESGTHARVNTLFGAVIKPWIQAYGGFQIERSGDGLLVLFESSTSAVRCALDVQAAVERQQAIENPDHPLQLRIGINVGDIIMDGDEIAGDDVNIAVRLQALAEPGAVCISAAVRGQLHEELDGAFEDLGDVALKNIGRPVHVYQMRLPGTRVRNRLWGRWTRRLRHGAVVAGASAALLATGVAWLSNRAAVADELPPMSVAVLPFKVAGTELGEGSARAVDVPLTRALVATGWLDVRDGDFVAQAAARASDAAALRTALNVRYAVQGRLEQRGGQLVADVQLLNTASRAAVWSTRLSAPEGPAAAGNLSSRLGVELRQAVFDAETRRFVDSKAQPRTAMEHMIRGDLERQHRYALEDERRVRVHYEMSLRVDPNFVPTMISLAYVDLTEADLDPGPRWKTLIDDAEQLSKRVVTSSGDNAPGWQLRAEVLARQWLWDAALDASARSLELDPSRAYAWGQRAALMLRLGQPAQALALSEQGLSHAPQRFGYVEFQRCRALMALGAYQRAAEACQRAISYEDWWLQRAYLAAAYALAGDTSRAAQQRARLRQLMARPVVDALADLRESDHPEFKRQIDDHLLQGLKLAGAF